MTDRRSFLVRSAATLAAGSLLAAQACSNAPAPVEPTDALLNDFVTLSGALLGVAAEKLAPQPDYANAKAEFYAAAQRHDAAALGALLQLYDAHRHQDPSHVADAALNASGTAMAAFARSIALAWLLGSWYDPGALERVAAGTGVATPSAVISANCYKESWAWKVAQTKAMGTSTQGFGYWTSPPPALSEFIG